ncbi:MAG TPA: hypothetical protein VNA27_07200, partial [Rubrobacteraceae bacterium]|nr:hypothetical protein [Rubrobacteraceae bacterium]
VEKAATGSETAWLTLTATSTGVRKISRIETSKTDPPAPMSAEPKPTKAPTVSRVDASKKRTCSTMARLLSKVSVGAREDHQHG